MIIFGIVLLFFLMFFFFSSFFGFFPLFEQHGMAANQEMKGGSKRVTCLEHVRAEQPDKLM